MRETAGLQKKNIRWASLLFLFSLFASLVGAGCDNPSQVQLPPPIPTAQQEAVVETFETIETETPTIKADIAGEAKTPVVRKTATPKPAPEPATSPSTASNGTYTNVDGNTIPSPYAAPSKPANASAQCRDGTYSFSQNRRGTCSHHGGVAEWY